MGFQSVGFGRLCSWDRSSAGGLAVLFAGVGFFCGTASAMATEIGIPFAGVQVLCGGASGVASEVWVQSAGVGPTFCVTALSNKVKKSKQTLDNKMLVAQCPHMMTQSALRMQLPAVSRPFQAVG